MAQITSIDYQGHTGEVIVHFNDSDIQSDYFHMSRYRQKGAIEAIKEYGADIIYCDFCNYDLEDYVKMKRFMNRAAKQTGKKFVVSDRMSVHSKSFQNKEQAISEYEKIKQEFEKAGITIALYQVGRSGLVHYVFANENIRYCDWRKIEIQEEKNVVKIEHIGYARKSKGGKALKLDISLEAFLEAERYETREGKEYVGLLVNMNKLMDILEGKREVTSVNQVQENKGE